MNTKINQNFYLRNNVLEIAKDLIGKWLFTNIDNGLTAGIITETEAYKGKTDKASHAYNGRKTERTKIMYYKGGVAYIYLCYGVHSLFNVVTNIEGVPDAILIRGIKPMIGKEIMSLRTNKITITPFSGKGPGLVSKLLGIHYSLSGENLTGNKIWIEDRNTQFDKTKIIQTTRIGVAYAGKDALLPYRFYLSPENL